MERLLVFGGSGLVGSRFCERQQEAHQLVVPTHAQVDVTDEVSVRRAVRDTKPDRILYAAGFARMDAAEAQPDMAFRLNAEAPGWIAEEAAKLRVPVCYLSTNAVFSGTRSDRPSREEDEPDADSVYGKSKWAGEKTVRAASPENIVLRLISVYRAHFPPRLDFARKIAQALERGEHVDAIADDRFNPLFVDNAVEAIAAVLHHRASGVYHLGATDILSNEAFVRLIAQGVHADPALIRPVAFKEFRRSTPSTAPRGPYQAMDPSTFRAAFGDAILQTNEQGVRAFIAQRASL